MAFLPDTRVEIAFDSGVRTAAVDRTWTDVSAYVELQDEIVINRGRTDEFSQTNPSTLSLTLDNSDGRFTPGRSGSPYYPNVKLGRPIRVTMLESGVFGNHLPVNAAGLEAASSVSDNWEAGGTVPPVLTRSTVRAVSGSASMLITWGTAGTLPLAQTKADVVTGLIVGRQYTASAYGYVPAGDPNIQLVMAGQTGTAMSTKAAFTRFSVTFTATASTHRLQVWPTSAPTSGDQAWIDNIQVWEGSAPVTFTTTLAEDVVDTRFTGYVDEWPIEWRDGTSATNASQVTASSRLARLGEGSQLKSVVEAEILADDPVAYYPLGESETAQFAVDQTGNDLIGMYSYYGGGGIEFGTGIGPGTDGLAAARIFPFVSGKQPTLAAYFDHTMTECTVECFVVLPRQGANANPSAIPISLYSGGVDSALDFKVLQFSFVHADAFDQTQGDATYFEVVDGVTTSLGLSTVYDAPENAFAIWASMFTRSVHHLALTFEPGVSPVLKTYIDGVLFNTKTGESGPGPLSTTMPPWSLLLLGPLEVDSGDAAMALSHAAVYDTILSDARIAAHAEAGLTGSAGETSGPRIERYAALYDIPAAEIAADTGTATVDHIDTTGKRIEELMRIVETTEDGVLFDARDGTLTFHDRNRRYTGTSAFTLDADAQELEAEGMRPVLDRSNITNSATARSVSTDSERTYEDAAYIEDYGPQHASLDIAASDSDALYQAAAWRVNRHKEPKLRMTAMAPVDVLTLTAGQRAAIAAADISTRFTADNLPTQNAATVVDYFVEGVTETIGLESWRFAFNVSATDVYDAIWILDDANRSQLGETTILAY